MSLRCHFEARHVYSPPPRLHPSSTYPNISFQLVSLPRTPISSSSVSAKMHVSRPEPIPSRASDSRLTSKSSDQPPRPPNAFLLFRSDFVKNIRQKAVTAEKLQQNHLSTDAAVAWRKLSQADKAPFFADAERQKHEHTRRYPDYQYSPKPSGAKAKSSSSSKTSAPVTQHPARHATMAMGKPSSTPEPFMSPSPGQARPHAHFAMNNDFYPFELSYDPTAGVTPQQLHAPTPYPSDPTIYTHLTSASSRPSPPALPSCGLRPGSPYMEEYYDTYESANYVDYSNELGAYPTGSQADAEYQAECARWIVDY